MPLSADQLQAIRVLDWLLDPNHRRSGRTLAIAVSTIRQALRNPGARVQFMDHAGDPNGRRIMIDTVRTLISRSPLRELPWVFHDRYLHVDENRGLENWLPELEGGPPTPLASDGSPLAQEDYIAPTSPSLEYDFNVTLDGVPVSSEELLFRLGSRFREVSASKESQRVEIGMKAKPAKSQEDLPTSWDRIMSDG